VVSNVPGSQVASLARRQRSEQIFRRASPLLGERPVASRAGVDARRRRRALTIDLASNEDRRRNLCVCAGGRLATSTVEEVHMADGIHDQEGQGHRP
jgi:hypothetical protein